LKGGALAGDRMLSTGPASHRLSSWVGGGNWKHLILQPRILGYIYVTLQNLGKSRQGYSKARWQGVFTRRSELAPPNADRIFLGWQETVACQKTSMGPKFVRGKRAYRSGGVALPPSGSFEELDKKGIPKTGIPEHRGGSIVTAGAWSLSAPR